MQVALAQMETIQGDIEANFSKMCKLVAIAKKRRADVVIFPEDALTGPVKGKLMLVDNSGKYQKRFSKLARKNKIDIVSGSFVESKDGKWYNTSCYFDFNGKLLGLYRKINLWHTERDYLTQGKSVCVFDTRFGRVGLAICWDLSNPLLFREMAQHGAKIIYVSSLWYGTGTYTKRVEINNINALCYARSFETECAVVFVNGVGVFRDSDEGIGNSQVVIPIRGAIKKLSIGKETLSVVEIPFRSAEIASQIYKIRKDIKTRYVDRHL